MTEDVFFASITEINARLKKKEFSAVELVRAFTERLEKTGPRYNALALPLTEIALRRAKTVDDDLKHERYRGPLQALGVLALSAALWLFAVVSRKQRFPYSLSQTGSSRSSSTAVQSLSAREGFPRRTGEILL